MKRIVLQSLAITNFKGIAHLDVNFLKKMKMI